MLKRCFISIELPEEVKKDIVKIQEELPEFYGKKTELENLHLTLKFLGEIDYDKIEKVKDKLKNINIGKINCSIDSLGFFSPNYIKIIWVHLNGCDEIQKEVDESLKDIFGKEKRFMSHITIARVKSVKDKKKFMEELKKIKFEEINFCTDRVYLMESVLKQKGPEYKIIECFYTEKI